MPIARPPPLEVPKTHSFGALVGGYSYVVFRGTEARTIVPAEVE
jgi:hypothetical protein